MTLKSTITILLGLTMVPMIVISQENADLFVEQGHESFKNKEYKQAIVYYLKAIELDSSNSNYFAFRGRAKHKLENYENDGLDYFEATVDYDIALGIDSLNTLALYGKGYVFRRTNPWKAIKYLNKTIELDSTYVEAFITRSVVFKRLGDYDCSLSDLNAAIQIDSLNAHAYNVRGSLKKDLKDNEGAIADYSKVIQISPDYAYPYNNRANIKRDMGDIEGACADYKKSAELGYYKAELVYNMHCGD